MPYKLPQFGLSDMLSLSLQIPRLCSGIPTMEGAAQRICSFLYDELRDEDGGQACALVRCYKTHPFADLTDDLKAFAEDHMSGHSGSRDMKCLTLLGSAGDEPEWNSRTGSKRHQAIPLPSPEIVEQAPMISQLIREFGLDIRTVIRPSPQLVRDLAGRRYGVFHVVDAVMSPYIPAQTDFVRKHGVASVLGFGGILPSGDLFAVILFSRVTVLRENAQRFKPIALDVKSCLAQYAVDSTFA